MMSPKRTVSHPYQRLQTQLAALLAATPPGDRLPAEPELAKQMGVSRATLREAMRSFEGQGLIRRRQGVGTFVIGQTTVIETGLEVLESIESLASRIGLEVSMGDLNIEEVQADEEQAAALNVEVGTLLVKISRAILTDMRPVAYLVDMLPENILSPNELKQGFTGSVLDLLMKRKNPPLNNSYTEISSSAASGEAARALQIQRGDVLLKLTARLYDTNGNVVDYSHSLFLPGYFHFHVVRKVSSPAA